MIGAQASKAQLNSTIIWDTKSEDGIGTQRTFEQERLSRTSFICTRYARLKSVHHSSIETTSTYRGRNLRSKYWKTSPDARSWMHA
eukprot:2722902-Pleurochrysis_carterae.AAC.1